MGAYVPVDDLHWCNYLLMLDITDILLAPEISLDEIGHLKLLTEDHPSTFDTVYASTSVIPKLHYLVHAPRLIIK